MSAEMMYVNGEIKKTERALAALNKVRDSLTKKAEPMKAICIKVEDDSPFVLGKEYVVSVGSMGNRKTLFLDDRIDFQYSQLEFKTYFKITKEKPMKAPYRTEERFNHAVVAIENFLHMRNTMPYRTADKTTNNYNKFKAEIKANGIMTVSTDGCENTIYSAPSVNVLARVWHDEVHLRLDVPFDGAGEYQVAQHQRDELVKWMIANGYTTEEVFDAGSIIYLDIMAQVEYYEKYARFVPFQNLFIMNKFLNEY